MSRIRSGVEVVASRGCARMVIPGMHHNPSSAASVSSSAASRAAPAAGSGPAAHADGPFAGLVICVTGLSKEARVQVKEATERLGGEYSGSLHPKCTHLVVQSFAGRKFEHALKHGPRNGLFLVTLGWFVDCVRRNMRLDESLYAIKSIGENGVPPGEFSRLVGVPVNEKSCLPPLIFQDKACSDMTQKHSLQTPGNGGGHDGLVFMNDTIYIDPGISDEMRKKISDAVTREGGKLLEHWFIGCPTTYIVCEDVCVKRYVGHSENIVTPLWILKTVKEKNLQRLVHLSSDLARHVAMVLENVQTSEENRKLGSVPSINTSSCGRPSTKEEINEVHQAKQKFVEGAKKEVRDRRARRMQPVM
uniref:BRCT domain-containing protein n=1 Tax=Zea mays TaxID=4577 RepID=A0A804Q922_MAIZE